MGTVTGSTFGAQWSRCCPGDYIPCSFHIQFFKKSNGMCTNGSEILFLWSRILYEVGNIADVHLQRAGAVPLSGDMGNSMHSIKASTQTSGRKESWSWGFRGAMQTCPNSSNLVASFAVNSGKSSHEYKSVQKRAISDSQRSSIIVDNICLMSFTVTNSKTDQKTNETFYGFFW